MEILRTPDARFENLPGYPFAPNYVEVDGLRMHYLDEGPSEAAPVLMLHGEPSWSYLYRHMIPVVVAAGHRVVAPDLVGFGRSDKPTAREDYTYRRHADWLYGLIERLDLQDITLFCQDWGGLLGLRLVGEHPDRFARVIAANTMLPDGSGSAGPGFDNWRNFSQTVPEFPTGAILQGATSRDLSPEEVAAYDAPFPDESYKAGARVFPMLVPTSMDDPGVPDNQRAWDVLGKFEKPFLTAFSDEDPVLGGLEHIFHDRVPGCRGLDHPTMAGGNHFLQEDCGPELGQVIVDFIAGKLQKPA